MSTKDLFKSVALQAASILPKSALGPKGLAIQAAIALTAAALAPTDAKAQDGQTIGGIAGTILGAAAGKKIGDGSTTNAVIGGILGGTIGSSVGKSVDDSKRLQQQGYYEPARPYGSYGETYPSYPQGRSATVFDDPRSRANVGYSQPYYNDNYGGGYRRSATVFDDPRSHANANYGGGYSNGGFGQPPQQTNNQAIGTVGGAVGGALIGKALGGGGPGAVVGAVLGGLAGSEVGKASDIRNAQGTGVYQVRQVNGQPFYPSGVPLRIANPGNLPADIYSKLSNMYQGTANLRATAERSHYEWQKANIDASLTPNDSAAAQNAANLRQRLNTDVVTLNSSYAQTANAVQTIRQAGYEPGDQFNQLDSQLRAPLGRNYYQFIDGNGNAKFNTGIAPATVQPYSAFNNNAQQFRQTQVVSAPTY